MWWTIQFIGVSKWIYPTENTRLPLALHDTTSYISTRRPKVMSKVNEHINLVLNSKNPDWDPSSPIYAQQESAMKHWKGEIRTRKKPNREVLSDTFPLPPRPKTNTPTSQPECMNEWTNTTAPTTKPNLRIYDFTSSLLEQVNISSISSTRRNGVSHEALAEKWDIGLTTAKRTTRFATQRGVRTVEHPSF